VACEALEVIGRCARIGDLARAAEAFEREQAIAEEHGLTLWRIRALHELGTVDLINRTSTDRLVEAQRLALRAGALGMALTLDLQILGGLVARNELEEAWQRATACVEQARRLGLRHVEAAGRVFRGRIHALRGRRAEVEAEVEAAMALGAGDPQTAASAWGLCRGILELVEGRRGPALRMLDIGMEFARQTVATVTQPSRGLWALERAAAGRDGAAACAEVRASGATVNNLIDGLVLCAQAVLLGRAGSGDAAARTFEHACSRLETGPWVRQYARRVVAECALEDGWGDPAGWLREAIGFFEAAGQPHLATACRALLRKAGVAVPRRGRGVSDVPPWLRARDVTSREADVLALVGEGLSNREIGERIYLSPRTVEKHVANLLLKLGAENRTRLVALASSLAP
jgi:DNA-binding CsgD family transcriptional regulator